jgi:CNT family concentrative nucleoside transporter
MNADATKSSVMPPTPLPTPLSWRLAIATAVAALAGGAYLSRSVIDTRGQAAAGIVCFFGLVAVFSANLRAVNWRTIAWGIALQIVLAVLVLKVPVVRQGFEAVGHGVKAFIGFSDAGARFVFGNLADGQPSGFAKVSAQQQAAQLVGIMGSSMRNGPLLATSLQLSREAVKDRVTTSGGTWSRLFRYKAIDKDGNEVLHDGYLFQFAFIALPPILFVSAFFTVLYHFGILQFFVKLMAKGMVYLMRTSGAETLSVSANVFMGQTEAPLIVKPYVPRMTNSELFTLMASGMAHISGGMMVVYINYGADPVAVLTTCVMACPCSLYLAKLFLPETGTPETLNTVHQTEKSPYVNAIDAAAAGTTDGLKLALNVAAMLIVFVAFVAMFDALLGGIKPALLAAGIPSDSLSAWPDDLSLRKVFGWLFSPAAFLMGVESSDVQEVGKLLGSKLAINEHFAYLQMKEMKAMAEPVMSPRSYTLAAFALTGFANFASVGIQLGGIGALAPNRRHDLARLGGRALFVGFVATLLNAAIAGVLL